MIEAAKTLDGWYCLHDFRTMNWPAWKTLNTEDIISFPCSTSLTMPFVLSPKRASATPTSSAKAIICNISPDAIASIGFCGIILKRSPMH